METYLPSPFYQVAQVAVEGLIHLGKRNAELSVLSIRVKEFFRARVMSSQAVQYLGGRQATKISSCASVLQVHSLEIMGLWLAAHASVAPYKHCIT